MQPSERSVRVLVTGAGGPAAIAVMKSLAAVPSVEILAADMDGWAAGLYLVPPQSRALVPAGNARDFVPALLALCRRLNVDVLVPTVDAELLPVSGSRAEFERQGVQLMLAPHAALAITLDKLALAGACAGVVSGAEDREPGHACRPGELDLPGHRQAAHRQRLPRRVDAEVGG